MSIRPVLRAPGLVLVGLLLAGLAHPSLSHAQRPDSTALDSALVRVDEMRSEGLFRDALSRLSGLRSTHGDQVEILWRLSFTRVDIGKTVDSDGAAEQHYREALKLAEAALTVDASNAHAHLARAVAEGRLALGAGTQERVQRSRAVKTHADRAIEIDPNLPGAFHVRGRWNREVADLNLLERTVVRTVYGGLPDASFEQAVRDFERAIELENVRFHHLELAKTYLKMDRPAEARAQLQTVIDLPAQEPFDQRYKEEAQRLLDELS
jgi:tetratricopeptide (TPR) repeat protein